MVKFLCLENIEEMFIDTFLTDACHHMFVLPINESVSKCFTILYMQDDLSNMLKSGAIPESSP